MDNVRWLWFFPLMGMILLGLTGVAGTAEVFPDRIEEEGLVIARAVDEEELGEMRGGYMGISFSVLLEGYWDNLGNHILNTDMPDDPGPLPVLPGQVQIQAGIGGLYGARGIFQIVQVPGSNNVVNTNMIVNISVIQIMGQSLANISNLLPW